MKGGIRGGAGGRVERERVKKNQSWGWRDCWESQGEEERGNERSEI